MSAAVGLHVAEVVMATGDFEVALGFWQELLGLVILDRADGVDIGTASLWRIETQAVGRRVLLGRPGGLCAIHLVELTTPGEPLRSGAGPLDALPKTLNLLVRDLPALWERLRGRGALMKGGWVEYEHEGGTYRDAHVLGPDCTNIGLLEIVGADYPVNAQGVGEPASFTFTVSDMAAEQAFYVALGGQLRLDRFFDGPAIEALVGLPPGGSLDMKLYGPGQAAARVELVSYGMPMRSRYAEAHMPATGALTVHLCGADMARAAAALQPYAPQIIDAAPWGVSRPTLLATAPSGARVSISA